MYSYQEQRDIIYTKIANIEKIKNVNPKFNNYVIQCGSYYWKYLKELTPEQQMIIVERDHNNLRYIKNQDHEVQKYVAGKIENNSEIKNFENISYEVAEILYERCWAFKLDISFIINVISPEELAKIVLNNKSNKYYHKFCEYLSKTSLSTRFELIKLDPMIKISILEVPEDKINYILKLRPSEIDNIKYLKEIKVEYFDNVSFDNINIDDIVNLLPDIVLLRYGGVSICNEIVKRGLHKKFDYDELSRYVKKGYLKLSDLYDIYGELPKLLKWQLITTQVTCDFPLVEHEINYIIKECVDLSMSLMDRKDISLAVKYEIITTYKYKYFKPDVIKEVAEIYPDIICYIDAYHEFWYKYPHPRYYYVEHRFSSYAIERMIPVLKMKQYNQVIFDQIAIYGKQLSTNFVFYERIANLIEKMTRGEKIKYKDYKRLIDDCIDYRNDGYLKYIIGYVAVTTVFYNFLDFHEAEYDLIFNYMK